MALDTGFVVAVLEGIEGTLDEVIEYYNRGGNQNRELGRHGVVLELELFRGTGSAPEVRFVAHPVMKERLFVTGQFHFGALVRHKCTH